MCLHFVASLFIFIGRNQYPNWIYSNHLENLSFIHIYITSIYFLIATITTVGYGDITPSNQEERWFGLILLIVGIIVYSFAVAGISNYIKEIDDRNADFNKKLKILEDIRMNHPNLSEDLYDRVFRFLKYKNFNEKKDKNIIIDCLPIGLRNTLVYEMYKPIINNFIFFKNFDNTDFIVRVILAFKPILSMKNDILVKDGDFIEEIIFVKKGRLSLEIPIDINSRNITSNLLTLQTSATNLIDKKDSILSNISLSPRKRFNNNNNNQYVDKFTLNPFQVNSTKTFHLNDISSTIGPKKRRTLEKKLKEKEEEEEKEREKNIQYVKILEIRKNEHFGDILMFLNKRSPLCAKVKSKKAEFYFLKKTDAIEISTCYPRIWNKINKKSLFNMEQIKRLINKVVRIFFNAHGLKEREYINPDKRFSTIVSTNENDNSNNSSELHSVPSISDSNTQNNNSEDYNNSIISKSSISNKTDDKKKKIINKFDIVKEEENDDESSSKSSKFSEKVNVEIPIPKINDINNECKNPNLKSIDINSSNDCSHELESIQTLKVENLGKKFIDFSDNISLSDSIINYEKNFFSTNSLSYHTPFRPEEINDEIYPNENGLIINLTEFKFLNLQNYDINTQIKNNENLKCSPEIHSRFKNSLILNNDNQISESSEISDKNIIFFDKDSENSNTLIQKVNLNHLNLDQNDIQKKNKTSTNLTYINKEIIKTVLTDKHLRQLIDNSPRNNNDTISIISTEISFTINSEYENIDLISKHKYSKSVELRNKIKKILEDDEEKEKEKEKDTVISSTRSNKINKNKNLLKNIPIIGIEITRAVSSRGRNNSIDITTTKKNNLQKNFRKTDSINDKDLSLLDSNKKKFIQRKSVAFGTKGNEKRPNLLNVISQNIEKNQMNLNNPDEFYSEYFSNILTKNVPNINNTKSSFINNTIQKNNNNIQRRKSAAYMNSLLKGISVDNVRRKSTKAGN